MTIEAKYEEVKKLLLEVTCPKCSHKFHVSLESPSDNQPPRASAWSQEALDALHPGAEKP